MKGFTFIEIIVAMTISMLVIGFASVKYVDFNRTQIIKNAGATLKNNLRDTQTKAITGIRPTGCNILDGYQVSFTPTTYATDAYCGAPSGNSTTYTLPPNLIFNPVPGNFRFNVLAQNVTNAPVSIFVRTSGSLTNSTKWFGICVASGGDIIDTGNCGYKVQITQPGCTCS